MRSERKREEALLFVYRFPVSLDQPPCRVRELDYYDNRIMMMSDLRKAFLNKESGTS